MTPTRRDALRSLAVTGTVAVAGCSTVARLRGPNQVPPDSLGTNWSPPDAEWRYPNADLHNTARSGLPTATAPSSAWAVEPSDSARAARRTLLAATRDAVFEVTGDERPVLRARDAADGAVRWQRAFDTEGFGGGGLVDGTLFGSLGETDVVALDATDGTTRWRVDLHDRVTDAVPSRFVADEAATFEARPFATPETVYVQTAYGLHGLAPGDGTERWRLYLGSDGDYNDRILRYPGRLAVGQRTVWAAYRHPAGRLFDVTTAADEVHVDANELAVEYPSAPVVAGTGLDAEVAFGQRVGSTGAISPVAAGDPDGYHGGWAFPGLAAGDGPTWVTGAATDGDSLFVTQTRPVEGRFELAVLALEVGTGGLVWSHREPLGLSASAPDFFDQLAVTAPVVAGGTVLVAVATDPGDGDVEATRTLLALGADEGTERWRVDPGVDPNDLVVAGDRLYVGGERGGLAALARSA